MSYAYGMKGAPAVGGGLPGLPRRAGNAQSQKLADTDYDKVGVLVERAGSVLERARGEQAWPVSGGVKAWGDLPDLYPLAYAPYALLGPSDVYPIHGVLSDDGHFFNGRDIYLRSQSGYEKVTLPLSTATGYTSLAISPGAGISRDGRTLVVCSASAGTKLRVVFLSDDLKSIKELGSEYINLAADIRGVQISPLGDEIAVLSKDGLRIFEFPSLTLKHTFPLDAASAATYSLSGDRIAVLLNGGLLSGSSYYLLPQGFKKNNGIWEKLPAYTGTKIYGAINFQFNYTSSFSLCGNYLAANSSSVGSCTIYRWGDTGFTKILDTVSQFSSVPTVTYISYGGRKLIIGGGSNGALLNPLTGAVISELSGPYLVSLGVAISWNEEYFFVSPSRGVLGDKTRARIAFRS